MPPSPAVYPVTPSVVDWMAHNLESLHQSTFDYYRSMRRLLHIVDLCEQGETTRRVANAAIRRYNEVHKHSLGGKVLCYEDIRDRVSKYLFVDAGGWEGFTDNPPRLITGKYDNPEEAFYKASEEVEWALLWLIDGDTLIVYRSPYQGRRQATPYVGETIDVHLCDGLRKGDLRSYTLPPGIEGAIRQDEGDEYANAPRQQKLRRGSL